MPDRVKHGQSEHSDDEGGQMVQLMPSGPRGSVTHIAIELRTTTSGDQLGSFEGT